MNYFYIGLTTLVFSSNLFADWDTQGVPLDLVEDVEVSSSMLRDINRVLPERAPIPVPSAHPEFFSGEYSTNIYLDQEAHVYVTFVHEGAGYRNSFGYFTFTSDSIPSSASEVEFVPVFPNASYKGSGGGLESGNTARIGPFPAGTFVGFWVKANAWDWKTQTVGSGIWTHFTLPTLNTEGAEDKKPHVAMFWHEDSQKLIMGFEDIHRESRSCDQDFNDLIFFATTDPVEAMDVHSFAIVEADYDADNDGIPDTADVYPDDDERASIRYYPAQNDHALLSFEDNFPYKADYDFNDLIVNYSSKEILDANGDLKELIINMKTRAMGALFYNGFAIQFPFAEEVVESAGLLINGEDASYYPIEAGHENETVANIMFAAPDHIANTVFPNTLAGTHEVLGDRFELRLIFKEAVAGVSWPYNPFIYIDQDRSREVHLVGYPPTEFADLEYFGQGDDASQPQRGRTYKDVNGMPFALLLPSTWEWPEEFVDITASYPKLISWAYSGGTVDGDWVNTSIDELLWTPDDLYPTSDPFDNDSKARFWNDVDLGTRPSLIEEIDQKLKITAAASDLWLSSNSYVARYTTLTGDFEVSVTVNYQENTHPWAKAGILFKDDMLNDLGNRGFVAITPSNGFIFQYDWQGNGEINGTDAVYAQTQGQDNYLKVARTGDIITTYARTSNAQEWQEIGSRFYENLPEALDVGLFAVSHSYDYGLVIFDDWVME